MSMVIMSGGNVFYSSPVSFQILLHMLKEPRLVVVANPVYLQENTRSLANTNTDKLHLARQIPLLFEINARPSVTV